MGMMSVPTRLFPSRAEGNEKLIPNSGLFLRASSFPRALPSLGERACSESGALPDPPQCLEWSCLSPAWLFIASVVWPLDKVLPSLVVGRPASQNHGTVSPRWLRQKSAEAPSLSQSC